MLSIVALILALPVLYGLHRLGLYLESRDVIYYWHKKPTGGSGYNPLQELVQPQIRHVIEVSEQQPGKIGNGEGEPQFAGPIVRPVPADGVTRDGGADCDENERSGAEG